MYRVKEVYKTPIPSYIYLLVHVQGTGGILDPYTFIYSSTISCIKYNTFRIGLFNLKHFDRFGWDKAQNLAVHWSIVYKNWTFQLKNCMQFQNIQWAKKWNWNCMRFEAWIWNCSYSLLLIIINILDFLFLETP